MHPDRRQSRLEAGAVYLPGGEVNLDRHERMAPQPAETPRAQVATSATDLLPFDDVDECRHGADAESSGRLPAGPHIDCLNSKSFIAQLGDRRLCSMARASPVGRREEQDLSGGFVRINPHALLNGIAIQDCDGGDRCEEEARRHTKRFPCHFADLLPSGPKQCERGSRD